jgi:hypothetical protein
MVGGLSENLPLPTGGDANLQNGTEDLFVNSLKINNLTANLPIKTDSDKDLYSTLLNISDVENLQSALDNKIEENPYIGTLQSTDLKTQNVSSVDESISDLQLLSDDAVYKSDPTTQVLSGDIQIPFGDRSYLVGQELDNLTGISAEVPDKTINIDGTTTTNYTKINGNTQTGLLTVKRDDGAAVSANTFEIKNALNNVIYSVNGLGQHPATVYSLQHPTDTRNIRWRINYVPFQAFHSVISSVGFGAYTTELQVMNWTSNNGGAGQTNTNFSRYFSNNFIMLQFRAVAPQYVLYTYATNISMPGTINSLTTVAGVFSQIDTKINTGTVEQTLITTGIGNLTVPANTFKAGDSYCLKLGGLKSNANNDTIEIMLKSGATILGTTGSIILPALSSSPYDVKAYFTIRTLGVLGTGLIHTKGFLSYTDADHYRGATFTGLNTIDTTVPNTLNVVSVQSAPGNTITCELLILSKIY